MIIETTICIAMVLYYDCDWTLVIGIPLRDNLDGATFFEAKVIYLTTWDACILSHEINVHAKQRNNYDHYGLCN